MTVAHSDTMTPHPHGDLIDAYLDHLRQRRCTRRTIGTYAETLHAAHATLPMGVPLATRDEIETWLGSGDWSTATIGLRLTVLRGFFTWAVSHGHLDRDSTERVAKPRTVRRHVPPATTEQVAAILTRTHGVTWLASLVAAHAGLRAIEIARLRREYISADLIDVREGKGGHRRQIPTHPLVWRAVVDMPAGPLIGTSERLLTSRCWRAYRRVDVPTSLHRLRKWFATELLRGGADLNTIRLLLGHRSLATTQLYLGMDPEAMTTAVRLLPVLNPTGVDDPARPAVHP